ncbi:hypothetical protein HDV00_000541 [Rhizophlyctis rosea]|nr:hypothetical protein HDV00_000541 [Rhizophlyctis rosea]
MIDDASDYGREYIAAHHHRGSKSDWDDDRRIQPPYVNRFTHRPTSHIPSANPYTDDFDYDEDEFDGPVEPPASHYVPPPHHFHPRTSDTPPPYPHMLVDADSPPLKASGPYCPLPSPRHRQQPSTSQISAPTHCGFIKKMSYTRAFHQKTWKPRFCVLVDSTLYLFRSDAPTESSVGSFPITERSAAFVSAEGLWVLEVRDEGCGGGAGASGRDGVAIPPGASALPESLAVLMDSSHAGESGGGSSTSGSASKGGDEEKVWYLQCADKESMMMWLDTLRITITNLKAGQFSQPQLKFKYSRPLNSIPGFGLPAVGEVMVAGNANITGNGSTTTTGTAYAEVSAIHSTPDINPSLPSDTPHSYPQSRPTSPHNMLTSSFRRLSMTIPPSTTSSSSSSSTSTFTARSLWSSSSSSAKKEEKQAAKEEEKERKKREKEEKERMKKMRFPYVTALDLLPPDMREEVLNMKV